jgi:hypothetical protein
LVLSRNTVRVVEIARDLCILKSPLPLPVVKEYNMPIK